MVAGQDFAAGLVRMGILPRLRYLLEVSPLFSFYRTEQTRIHQLVVLYI